MALIGSWGGPQGHAHPPLVSSESRIKRRAQRLGGASWRVVLRDRARAAPLWGASSEASFEGPQRLVAANGGAICRKLAAKFGLLPVRAMGYA